MHGIFQDSNGNRSSKRVAAFIILPIALGVTIYIAVTGKDGASTLPWIWGALTALLGVGIFEKRG